MSATPSERVRAFLTARSTMRGPLDQENVHEIHVGGERLALTVADLWNLVGDSEWLHRIRPEAGVNTALYHVLVHARVGLHDVDKRTILAGVWCADRTAAAQLVTDRLHADGYSTIHCRKIDHVSDTAEGWEPGTVLVYSEVER